MILSILADGAMHCVNDQIGHRLFEASRRLVSDYVGILLLVLNIYYQTLIAAATLARFKWVRPNTPLGYRYSFNQLYLRPIRGAKSHIKCHSR